MKYETATAHRDTAPVVESYTRSIKRRWRELRLKSIRAPYYYTRARTFYNEACRHIEAGEFRNATKAMSKCEAAARAAATQAH